MAPSCDYLLRLWYFVCFETRDQPAQSNRIDLIVTGVAGLPSSPPSRASEGSQCGGAPGRAILVAISSAFGTSQHRDVVEFVDLVGTQSAEARATAISTSCQSAAPMYAALGARL